jgi:hypothetical protein
MIIFNISSNETNDRRTSSIAAKLQWHECRDFAVNIVVPRPWVPSRGWGCYRGLASVKRFPEKVWPRMFLAEVCPLQNGTPAEVCPRIFCGGLPSVKRSLTGCLSPHPFPYFPCDPACVSKSVVPAAGDPSAKRQTSGLLRFVCKGLTSAKRVCGGRAQGIGGTRRNGSSSSGRAKIKKTMYGFFDFAVTEPPQSPVGACTGCAQILL